MSFVAKPIAKVFGGLSGLFGAKSATPPAPAPLVPSTPTTPSSTVTVAPTVDNSSQDLDVAAQKMAASIANGRTSTMLTGGEGETEDKKYTSKILLGQ